MVIGVMVGGGDVDISMYVSYPLTKSVNTMMQEMSCSLLLLWCQANKIGENTLLLCIVIGGGEEEVIVNSELIDDTAKFDNAEDRE